MERIWLLAALFFEALLLLWFAKWLWAAALRRNVVDELTHHDNPATAITVSGYFFGVLIALSGVMASPGRGIPEDLISFALYGLTGVAVLFASLFGAPLVGGVKLQRDIVENRNPASAIVLFSTFVATGIIFSGAVRGPDVGLTGWVALLVFQLLGQVVLAVMAHLFELITPYDLHAEVERHNVAAAIGYGGALVAMGVILFNAVSGDFTSWTADLSSFAIYCLPLLALYPIRILVVNGLLLSFRNLNHEIAVDRNVGAGVLEATTYVGLALLYLMAA